MRVGIGYTKSSESRKCIVCGKMTSAYKEYEKSNITIRVPLCDNPVRNCIELIDISTTVNTITNLIRIEVSLQKDLEKKNSKRIA